MIVGGDNPGNSVDGARCKFLWSIFPNLSNQKSVKWKICQMENLSNHFKMKFYCLLNNQCSIAQVSQRKLSTDFVRKLSAISVASDVSCISGRFIYIFILS